MLEVLVKTACDKIAPFWLVTRFELFRVVTGIYSARLNFCRNHHDLDMQAANLVREYVHIACNQGYYRTAHKHA